MRTIAYLLIAGCLAGMFPAAAAESPAVRLVVKPLLCVTDRDAPVCTMTFNIRWKGETPADYCLNDSFLTAPLRCWAAVRTGEHRIEREVSEEFLFWLGDPAGTERLAEVKISVLRVGSSDRRRERRTRHVWDVL